MNRGAPLARIYGIPIVVDASWVIIAVLATWVLFGELWLGRGDAGAGVVLVLAVVGALAFFASLLAHELSHSVVAVRRGLRVRRIRLFVFGGVSEIEQEAGSPRDELAITVAGPALSLALAGVFLLAALAVPARAGAFDRLLEILAVVNLALGVFNLLPGFPLDGGRVLRAVVWRITGDYGRATRVAVAGGRLIAGLLVAGGLALLVLAGAAEGLWWVAIGWFLWAAAGSTLRRLRVEERLRGVRTAALMRAAPIPVAADLSMAEFEPSGPGPWAPVVRGGRVRGWLDVAHASSLGPQLTAGWKVGDLMEPIGPDDVVDASAPALAVVPRLDDRRPLVVVSNGRMVGMLSGRILADWLRKHA